MRLMGRILAAAAVIGVLGTPASAAQSIRVELNKLEAEGGSCRAYMVTENSGDQSFQSLKLDLVMFDGDGIISKRLAVDLGPLPAGKTRVKVFGIDGVGCQRIGRVLLNEVLTCDGTDGCGDLIAVGSRSDVPFVE